MHRFSFLALWLALCLPAGVVNGATHFVQIKDFHFMPTNLNISAGDTVTWTNTVDREHDSTGTTVGSTWASGDILFRGTFSRTFNITGTFDYFCQQHFFMHPEQTGRVFVATANLSPSVSLTNPPANARFLAPAGFTLRASATDSGGVTNVHFFLLSTSLGNDTTAPYEFAISNLAAGNYSFTARAVDNLGLAATSAPVSVQVLTNATVSGGTLSNGTFRFSVPAIAGQTYVAEFSTNLLGWAAFATNTNATAVIEFTDSAATTDNRYYRVRQDF